MDESDELDIELQDPDDIGSRLILLSALTMWPDLSSDDERDHWWSWLEREGVLDLATPDEIDALNSQSQDEESSARAMEAMLPLAWTVGLLQEIPLRRGLEPDQSIHDGLPMPTERVEPFLNGLILLDEDDIALERERAEVWNWRIAAEVQRRRSAPGETTTEIEEAIREVVLEAAAAMVIADNDGTDLLIGGAPVREIEPDHIEWLLIVFEERLRALNWVCGLTEWDQVDIAD